MNSTLDKNLNCSAYSDADILPHIALKSLVLVCLNNIENQAFQFSITKNLNNLVTHYWTN